MQEKSLRIYSTEKTFFNKVSNTLSKLLIPTKVGINGIIINMKRNNLLKAYDNYNANLRNENEDKKAAYVKKYEDAFTLYLDAIDKNIMDSVYKKVKNDTANEFEKAALSKYYLITELKNTEFVEYKHRKQKYLLELDYENIKYNEKSKVLEKYKGFYCSKMESLYKGIIKHYSVKLTENLTHVEKAEIYEKIFNTLEDYITNIFPLKIVNNESRIYKELASEYEKYEKYSVGKLDQAEVIDKNMILLGISRKLFTHSLPLVVAEQCYIKLLKDTRALIVDTRIVKKREKAYELLLNLIDDYNMKVLSTKVYWDKQEYREQYKQFWNKYKEISTLENSNKEEYNKQKEILFIVNDLKHVSRNENKYCKIIKFYKDRLVELGVMKKMPNKCITKEVKYIKKK
ncbi:MAG: hypothetical protein E7313_05835 [Clostridiales bacterium]|nr:hypothetical protein [Clostridiales bacterium]